MRQLNENLISEISSYRVLDAAYTWLKALGYEISAGDVALSKRSFASMLARFRGLYEQGANISRLTKYVRLWIKGIL